MPGTRRTAAEGEQRRTQILDAAERTIARTGFEGFRVRDIADQVGINIATLHYYFPTKQALIEAMAQRIVRTLKPVQPSLHDARQALTNHIGHILTRFAANRDQFVILNELNARAARDAELHGVLRAYDEDWADYLRDTFVAGRAAGQFRADLDPEGATVLVLGFLKGLVAQLDLTPQRCRQAADEIIRAVTARDHE
ncbi:TetR/AcrR family transcriptional regulator [Kutzneria sp. CA-103260]|uniref:TetR/AcrR family transcriptional regulator n=1 Tax=Kutzneria sp. CA-103260 TaxID=2802641 RepID=UPI001BAB740A|nr:TetR family transcriptional regulator [Kutzneria sp. CA-103260]QUQ67296.1 TetR family transcriptional regulator [Kutzneria sp. CA-103260]